MPTDAQILAFQSAFSESEKVTTLNLLKFRDATDYTGSRDELPCSGSGALERWEKGVSPILALSCAQIIFSQIAKSTVIGPGGEAWGKIILVTYPNAKVMAEMLMSSDYQAIAHH